MSTIQDLPTNYYTILKLPITATEEDIRASYKDEAKRLHPDKRPNDPKATSEFQLLQEAYSTLYDPLKKAQYDAHFHSTYTYYQSRHAQQQSHHHSNGFNPEYEFARYQDPRRFRPHSPLPRKPAPSPAEIYLRERREKEHRQQLRKDEKSWEKFAKEFAKGEKEKVKQRVAKEGPIPEWLENVVEVDGYVSGKEPVAMEGEVLIDFEEDLIKFNHGEVKEEVPRPVFPDGGEGWCGLSEAATAGSFAFETINPIPNESLEKENSKRSLNPEASTFESAEWKEDEFGRPGERLRKRGSLGSLGRKAADEARRANNLPARNEEPTTEWEKGKTEWDIFFDKFETGLKV